jgi:hypothetical protein
MFYFSFYLQQANNLKIIDVTFSKIELSSVYTPTLFIVSKYFFSIPE